MSRWLPFGIMFLVCFAGVYAALVLHDRGNETHAADSLKSVVTTQPVNYSKQSSAGPNFVEASRKLMPAVVSVDNLGMNPFSDEVQLTGQGSGVIITTDGYIVTNNHVIEGAQEVQVHLMNGKQYPAQIIGRDPIYDLALIKVNVKGLPAAEIGDSDDLQVGEWVLALGNPLGYEGTLSVGIVSALNRDLPGGPSSAPLVGAIQTDAAINQGNSGGALANIHGQLIGINTQIATPNRGSVGIGFAIPSNRVRKAIKDILQYGRVRHADLGITRFAPAYVLQHPRFADEIGPNPPQEGLVIADISEQSPLGNAGLKQWDVITEIDGKKMSSLNDYLTYLLKASLGQKAAVKYWTRGTSKNVEVTLQEITQ